MHGETVKFIFCLFHIRKNCVNCRYSQVFVAANELHNGRRWHWYLPGEMFSGSSRLVLCGCVWLPLQYKCSEWTKFAIINTVTVKYPCNTQRRSSKHTCKYTHTHTQLSPPQPLCPGAGRVFCIIQRRSLNIVYLFSVSVRCALHPHSWLFIL
jgi:hypothetical protein